LNATITGFLLNTAFGFDYYVSSASIVLLVLTYSMVNGLKTSTVIGIIQMFFVLTIMGILLIALFMNVDLVKDTYFLGTNNVRSFFNQDMVLSVGIPIAIIVITQPFVDQMIFQRLIALKKTSKIFKAFSIAGILCGATIFLFGTAGFIGHYLSDTGQINVTDTQMAVVQTIHHYFPGFGVLAFLIAFFAIVFSTIDAGYCAIAALTSIDIYKRYINENVSDKTMVNLGRASMVMAALFAVLLAIAKLKILWMLFIIGTIGGAMTAPIIFAMCVRYIHPHAITTSIFVALLISVPLSIYGNIVGNSMMVSGASIGSILIGALICYWGTKIKRV